MKFFSLSLISICLVFALVIPSFAMTAEELLKNPDLSAVERDTIAKIINKESTPVITNPQNLDKWRELGDAFAETIKKICQTLNVEVNAFLKSDVGKLTAAVIVYKMVGHDILRIVIYGSALFMITIICGTFVKVAFIKKKIKNKETKEITYVDRIEWPVQDVKVVMMILTIVVWIAFTWALLYNII